ncbi:putative C-factor [Nannochloris sp. 'desiccata']|nr:hypothetical protein KSW81_000963 [Chlorella desiccata (nom. nud.)]KAH7620352.1 putative C-factor [Chlorella desiccata (nom. nud.)]
MPALTGKTVIVTGASRGIGLEFVKQLASKGNKVVAACRQPDAAKEKLQQIEGEIAITQLDVASPTSIEKWASEVQQLAPHVDVLINNAGVYGERINLDTVTSQHMLEVFQINTIGPLIVVQQLRKHALLGGSKGSTIIANVTSKVGSIADNKSGGGYAYRSSKSALNIITKSLSIDLESENVVATLLHPGYVKTDMTNGNGLITKEESVAGMLAVLENHSEEELQGTWRDYKDELIAW